MPVSCDPVTRMCQVTPGGGGGGLPPGPGGTPGGGSPSPGGGPGRWPGHPGQRPGKQPAPPPPPPGPPGVPPVVVPPPPPPAPPPIAPPSAPTTDLAGLLPFTVPVAGVTDLSTLLQDTIAATESDAVALEQAIQATLGDATQGLGDLIDRSIAATDAQVASEASIESSVLADLTSYVLKALGPIGAVLYSSAAGTPAENLLNFGGLPGYGPAIPPAPPAPPSDATGLTEFVPTTVPIGLPLVPVTGGPAAAPPPVPFGDLLPFGLPGGGVGGVAQPVAAHAPGRRPTPGSGPSRTPKPVVSPQPAPFPLPAPGAGPAFPGQPSSKPPAPSNQPNFFGAPLGLPAAQPCDCAKQSRTRKKKKPREECWKGTYVELANGLIKTRKEKITCR